MTWDAIAVTCKTKEFADAIRTELRLRQKKGCILNDTVLLCVDDPQEGLGSGGATLNALLVVAEHLSAKNKLTVVSADILENVRILILHLGRYFTHDPCGRAFVSLPYCKTDGEMQDVLSNFDVLYNIVTNQLNSKSPPGLWVCSTDMILSLPYDIDIPTDALNIKSGVCCISVPASVEYAKMHGVYKIDENGTVNDIIYKGSEESIKTCLSQKYGDGRNDTVPLVSGIVFFTTEVTVKLLSLHTCAPLDACTYMGIDSGVEPIQISLYFDILLSMSKDVKKEDFIGGTRGSLFGLDGSLSRDKNMQLVRSTLWEHFSETKIKAVVLECGKHRYLDITNTPLEYTRLMREQNLVQLQKYTMTQRTHSYVAKSCSVAEDCMLINSYISGNISVEEGSYISHSCLKGDLKIGKNCVIIGLDENSSELIDDIPDNSFLMGCNIQFADSGLKKIFCCVWDCDKISISDDINSLLCNATSKTSSSSISRNDLLRSVISEASPLPHSYLNLLPKGHDSHRLQHKTLFTAKLFPVLHARESVDIRDTTCLLRNSISVSEFEKWKSSWKFSIHDLLEQIDHSTEFSYRRNLNIKISCQKIKLCLTNNEETNLHPLYILGVISGKLLTRLIHGNYISKCQISCQKIKLCLTNNEETNLHPLYILGVISGKHEMLLDALDEAAIECVSLDRSHLCARVFSCIAEVLALIAGDDAGLRSGPAANKDWKKALLMLERNEMKEGIKALAKIRSIWMDNPDSLIRAARHYERAEHIFVRHACTTVAKFIRTFPGNMLEKETWLICECPTRIDLSGGWSDTPPICYENGGTVVNVALLMENKRPVGARVRLIDEPVIVMTTLGDSTTSPITCNCLNDFRDYCQPQAKGALLKSCFVLCEVISLDSTSTLEEQLLSRYGGGIEIQTWSNLPRGSGLGTSSILAGAVIMALLHAVGKVADIDSVIHAVLMVEQMLTTGGGWQDQVGGMVGGIKSCSSKAGLPLQVSVEPISASDEFLKCFEDRIKLIYTGRTRLARNVLQDVLRNWYAKTPEIISNCKNLVKNALTCKEAFENGDLQKVGDCVNEYWRQKKIMAPGCEPSSCTEIMRILRPHVIGQTLAGAGGGGFLCIILKEPSTKEFIYDLLKNVKGAEDFKICNATVDMTGAQIYRKPVQ